MYVISFWYDTVRQKKYVLFSKFCFLHEQLQNEGL